MVVVAIFQEQYLRQCIDKILGYIGGDRQWVKNFGASDKSQAVYELAAWLDSLGLKLSISVKQLEQA